MKKLILSLVVALALIGAVYGAAASIGFSGVDKLGSGASIIVTDTSTVTDVSYNLLAADKTRLDSLNITFGQIPAASSLIDIQLWPGITDGACSGGVLELTDEASITSGTLGSSTVYTFNLDDSTNAGDVDCVDVTIVLPV